ncbi:hypothetical protein VE04_10026 [Pseudogymnoascus sp. 24MN13]|nr:hypothetical protein VE04_10026 [Pseudogymnoascus sp. 24MN13]
MGYWPPVAGAVPFYAFSNPSGGQGQTQNPGQQQGQGQQGNQQPPIYNRALYAPQPPQSNYPPRPQSSDESIPPHQQQQQQYSMSLPYPSSSSASDQQQQQQPVQHQQQAPQHDAYGPRPPPTPTYAFPPTTAHPFPSYTQPSPPPARLSPTTTTGAGAGGPYRPFPYALPTLSGAVMSNVHSPGSQLSLLSAPPGHGMSQQQQHHGMQGSYPLYASHGVPHGVGHGGLQQYGVGVGGGMQLGLDRPFKCDQCPQSFNRNHDLKRHKRIHLAVKPYPCGECEKSFSRKDALKRHVLVKGCGKPARPTSTSHHQSSSISAPSTQRRYTTTDIKTEGTLSSDAESPGGRRGSDE